MVSVSGSISTGASYLATFTTSSIFNFLPLPITVLELVSLFFTWVTADAFTETGFVSIGLLLFLN